jgi:hypothetical protein
MREGTTDIRTPVRFLLNLQLQQDEPRYLGADFGVANINQYPILNQREAHKEIEIPFHKSCGGDDLCESKLQVRKFVLKQFYFKSNYNPRKLIQEVDGMKTAYDCNFYNIAIVGLKSMLLLK